MELALDVAGPKLQEAPEFGKIRSEVELLPDKALQQIGVVRHPIDDLGGGQPILTKMGNGCHSGLLFRLVPANREHAPSVSPQQQKTGQNSGLAARLRECCQPWSRDPLKPPREGLIKSVPETFMLAACLPEAGICQS